ncbi:TPA: hypothetical protein F3P23_21675 [Aeromonas hydrophila]|nr:hypothetical protein [Aeromonas hydrophila]
MAAFVTLNHIQTIDDKVRRAEAACRLGKGDSCNLRAQRRRVDSGPSVTSLAHRGKPRLPGGSWGSNES